MPIVDHETGEVIEEVSEPQSIIVLPDMDNHLAVLDYLSALDRAITEAYDVAELLQHKSHAEAIKFYYSKIKLDKNIANNASASNIRSQAKIGELLAQLPKNGGGNPNWLHDVTSSEPTYEEMGIDKVIAHRYQTIARVPAEDREDFIHEALTNEREVTAAGMYKYAKNYIRAHQPNAEAQAVPATIDLVHGDMLDKLNLWQGDCFDLIIGDAPYNVTPWEWDKLGDQDQFMAHTQAWLNACLEVCKPEFNLFWFCSPSYMADIEMLMRNMALPIQSRIVWHRRNMAKGSDAKQRFIDSYEMIFHIGNRPLNFPADWTDARFDVQTFAVPQTNFSDTKYHPTQKPLELIRRLVSFGSYAGDRVLDPFAGGGTTGEACLLEANRTCVLIEKEAEYVEAINRRLSKQF